MPTFTESDVLNAVSVAMGSPSEIEYSKMNKQDALRRGLIQYSQFRPLKKIGQFETVKDQQDYDIGSSYSYLIGITGVFYGLNDSIDLSSLYGNVYDNFVNTAELRGINTLDQEALRYIDSQMISVIQASQRYDYHKTDDNTIALIPVPIDVRTIFFTYSTIRSLSDLRENDYQDIVDFTFLVSASALANNRNKVLQQNTPDLGFIMFRSGKFLDEQVGQVRKRLMNKFGVNSFIAHG